MKRGDLQLTAITSGIVTYNIVRINWSGPDSAIPKLGEENNY
jgi:hypothetical protein